MNAKITRDKPPTVWRDHSDGEVESYRVEVPYPGKARIVTPADPDFAEVKAQHETWKAFLVNHNPDGARKVFQRVELWKDRFTEVGTVEVRETIEVTKYFPYAADWLCIIVEPQTVPIHTNGYYVTYGLTGTIKSGGQNMAGPRNRFGHNVGDTYTASQQPYAYLIDDALDSDQTGNSMVYTVDPEKYAAWMADRLAFIEQARQQPRRYWTWNYDVVEA